MLQITRGEDYVSPIDSCNILNRHTQFGTGIYINLDKVLYYQSDAVKQLRPLYVEFSKMAGSFSANPNSSKDRIEILTNRFNVPIKFLQKHNSVSIDKNIMADLLVNPEVSEDAKEFLRVLQQISKLSHRYSSLKSYADLPLLDCVDHDGNRVVKATPLWCVLATARIACREPSFQNIDKTLIDIITWLDGQIFIEADSSQIEPRITYSYFIKDYVIKGLILAYGDAYFGILHYVTAPREELLAYYTDPTKIKAKEITEEMKKQRKDLKVLTLSTNYGGEEYANKFDIGPAFIARIKNHKLRLKLQAEAEKRVAEGYESCFAAFGTEIRPEENDKYQKGKRGWNEHLVRCFINNPVQATAAELMNISVKNADRLIMSCKNKSIFTSIVGYVHDCGKFYISEDNAELVTPLKNCMAYQVREKDGTEWIPISCDLKINGVAQE